MKFIAIGELMLRLSPPNYEKLVTTHDFRVNYGGAEANVAVSLANLGVDSTFFTVLPNSDLGKSTINYLKSNDVHTKHIIRSEGRMGLYYLEEGVSVRPSQVIYDRADSAFIRMLISRRFLRIMTGSILAVSLRLFLTTVVR